MPADPGFVFLLILQQISFFTIIILVLLIILICTALSGRGSSAIGSQRLGHRSRALQPPAGGTPSKPVCRSGTRASWSTQGTPSFPADRRWRQRHALKETDP
jgi:hypothetical protein